MSIKVIVYYIAFVILKAAKVQYNVRALRVLLLKISFISLFNPKIKLRIKIIINLYTSH